MKSGARTTIMCEKKIVVEARRSFTNSCKARIDAKEGDAECLVGLEKELFIMSCSNLAKPLI